MWKRLLQWLGTDHKSNSKATRYPARRTAILSVEQLESRLQPATYYWVGGAAGNPLDWSEAANWTQGGGRPAKSPPDDRDTAVFNSLFALVPKSSVDVRFEGEVKGLEIRDLAIDLRRTLVVGSTFRQDGGSITGQGDLRLKSATDDPSWLAGTWSGVGRTIIEANAKLLIADSGARGQPVLDGREIIVRPGGEAVWAGMLEFQNSAALTIQKNGRVLAGSGAEIQLTGSGTLTNRGQFTNDTLGKTTIQVPFKNFRGDVFLKRGTLSLKEFVFAAGDVSGSADLEVTNKLQWSGGTMGTTVGRIGAATLADVAEGEITGDAVIGRFHFFNHGSIVAHDLARGFLIRDDGLFRNEANGEFELTDSSGISGNGEFVNRGYFLKSGGSTSVIRSDFRTLASSQIVISTGSKLAL